MPETELITTKNTREILFYRDGANEVKIEVLLQNENLWLTYARIAELFGVQKAAVSKHLKNIFEDGELIEEVVISKMETTTQHEAISGKTQTHLTSFYNLYAIIAVGYRVNSKKATMFRILANKILKEYIIKCYVMNDNRLKEPEYYDTALRSL